ncbi:MAG: 50S ribosomal protein L11 methyltransferase [Panacibacter sp.]
MQANYIQVTVRDVTAEQSEMLIALLAEVSFDGFEETENKLNAFTTEEDFSGEELNAILTQMSLSYSKTIIRSKNWNEEWEKNFEPVIVDDFVAVRADFHEIIRNVEHEIIITPKMSFGTGHHATTYLMLQQMRKIDFANKTVFDFGTGTGILAILAEKLGAHSVLAIDNDEWSIDNARENIEKNNCSAVNVSLKDAPLGGEYFDIILANINKNVILEYISTLFERLKKEGHLLLSGLLEKDETDILAAVKTLPLKHISTTHRNNWICIMFSN